MPENLRTDVFKAYHDDLGHQGRDRTLSLIKRRLYWPGMDAFVSQKIQECGRCIRRKVLPTRAADMVNIVSTAPLEVVSRIFSSSPTITQDTPRRFRPATRRRRPLQRLYSKTSLVNMDSRPESIVTREPISSQS